MNEMLHWIGLDLSAVPSWAWIVLAGAALLLLLIVVRGLRRAEPLPLPEPVRVPARPAQSDGKPVPGIGEERRTAIRRAGNPTPVFVKKPGGDSLKGVVLDRSVGGLRLQVPEAIEVRSILEVRPQVAAPSAPWVKVEVRYCQGRDEQVVVGCRFVEELPLNVLLLFG